LGHFNQLTEIEPEFAEGWNKRATVLYLMGRFKESEEDILRTLKLEPRHFGALSGQGLIRMALEDWSGAITVLEAGLRIHPHMSGVIRNLEYVRKKQKESMT
jgi:tetratricopeptide (TPR) repeat protein